jgi:uncharacterized BrkB/YihY/UPF0761 family membrane protein
MKQTFIEIWGDVVELKALVFAILFISFTTMTGYYFAPADDRTKQLFFGLIGAIIGFTITARFIKPKRRFKLEETVLEEGLDG